MCTWHSDIVCFVSIIAFRLATFKRPSIQKLGSLPSFVARALDEPPGGKKTKMFFFKGHLYTNYIPPKKTNMTLENSHVQKEIYTSSNGGFSIGGGPRNIWANFSDLFPPVGHPKKVVMREPPKKHLKILKSGLRLVWNYRNLPSNRMNSRSSLAVNFLRSCT